jgi:hypothetical protein
MKIEDKGVISEFEAMPSEVDLYLSVVSYSQGSWIQGGQSYDKNELIKMLQSYSGIEAARIYCVKVPVKNLVTL